jgi:hypothetical protein
MDHRKQKMITTSIAKKKTEGAGRTRGERVSSNGVCNRRAARKQTRGSKFSMKYY